MLAATLAGCKPGYIKTSDLERSGQGPNECRSRCHELDMEMGAFVLLGDKLPACVCQPVDAPSAPGGKGAAATGAGYVVIAAAAAAAQQNQQAALPQTYRPR